MVELAWVHTHRHTKDQGFKQSVLQQYHTLYLCRYLQRWCATDVYAFMVNRCRGAGTLIFIPMFSYLTTKVDQVVCSGNIIFCRWRCRLPSDIEWWIFLHGVLILHVFGLLVKRCIRQTLLLLILRLVLAIWYKTVRKMWLWRKHKHHNRKYLTTRKTKVYMFMVHDKKSGLETDESQRE